LQVLFQRIDVGARIFDDRRGDLVEVVFDPAAADADAADQSLA